MSDSDNPAPKLKVVFAPGCLEMLEQEMSPEELQAFMDDLNEAIQSGSMFTDSQEVDLEAMEVEDPELFAQIQEGMAAAMEQVNSPTPANANATTPVIGNRTRH